MNSSQQWTEAFFLKVICVLVVALNIYFAWAMGATFWVDSYIFVMLGEALKSSDAAGMFYNSPAGQQFAHITPGTAMLWVLVSGLPEHWQWPVLVGIQRITACVCLIGSFYILNKIYPSKIHILFCILILAIPFYQSFHNALMSESIGASLLLLSFALAAYMTTRTEWSDSAFLLSIACLFLITQFRVYYGMMVGFLVCLAVVKQRRYLRAQSVLLLAAGVASILIFPVYKYMMTGSFSLPSGGINYVYAGFEVNLKPSGAVMEKLSEFDFPEKISVQKLASNGIDYFEMTDLGTYWASKGYSEKQIFLLSKQVGSLLKSDGMSIYFNRVLLGLNSCGMLIPYKLGPVDSYIIRGQTYSSQYAYQKAHYNRLSWTALRSYEQMFIEYFREKRSRYLYSGQEQSFSLLANMLSPYIVDRALYLKDPLRLTSILPDFWVLFGLLSAVFLFRYFPYVGGAFLVVIATNFLVMFAFPLGDIRYAYGILLLAVYITSLGVSVLYKRFTIFFLQNNQ